MGDVQPVPVSTAMEEVVLHRPKKSAYLEWAKLHSGARYSLVKSGVPDYPIADLPVQISDLEIGGGTAYGYEPLQRQLANRYAVPATSVVATTGTSMANHLVMATLLDPGDEVLIELPTYEPLVAVARYLGAKVKRFERSARNAFRVDPREVARRITADTRLIVITNLHNPSSVLTDAATLLQVAELARTAGAKILVDEVYLETLFGARPLSAFHLGNDFIITSSLTKAYGLSGLRCGWVLARPDLAERMWRLNDLFGVVGAHPAERLSVIALQNLEHVGIRARALLDENRALLSVFLAERQDLESIHGGLGTTVFPRLRSGAVADLCKLLQEKYQVAVVPGEFFGMVDHFRLGIGGPTDGCAEGLSRLRQALDELAG